jgi:phage anti-repressor protein
MTPTTNRSSQALAASSNNPNTNRLGTGPTIDVELLYQYVGSPSLPCKAWASSLPLLMAELKHVPSFWLASDDSGKLALSPDLALHFANRVCGDLLGAIAFVLITESLGEASSGNPYSANQSLRRFQSLAAARGKMLAETFHAFLQVADDFEKWIVDLKEKHGMKYGRDYLRVTERPNRPLHIQPKDSGKGTIFFGPGFATKVAMAEPTPRGKMVKQCIEAHRQASDYTGLFVG